MLIIIWTLKVVLGGFMNYNYYKENNNYNDKELTS